MKKRRKENNKEISASKAAVILIIAAIVAVLLTGIFYNINEKRLVYRSFELNATLSIGNIIGFAVDTNVLNFGIAPKWSSVIKEITIYHDYKKPLKINVVYSGTIAKFLRPIQPFYLKPKEEKRINIVADANGEYGNYTGTVKVLFLRE